MNSTKTTEIYSDEMNDENIENQDRLTSAQEFIHDQNHCCLCGAELHFTHKMDHLTLTVLEDARCNTCHISLRTRNHSLQ